MSIDGEERRNRDWFEALFRDHHTAVLAYAARRVGSEADDVVAEVFAVAWRRRDDVPDDPLPWLYRTAAHHVLHARRGEARRGGLAHRVGGVAAADADPLDEQVGARLDAERVLRALAALPPGDAEVLRLWAWEGLDAGDLAAVLGCSAATARMRLFRARRRARALLDAGTPAPAGARADADPTTSRITPGAAPVPAASRKGALS